MNPISPTAMVLAAGLGTRMRPLTLQTPKPLLQVGGRTMLNHALDKLVDAGITRAVVNTFHLAEQIEKHLASRKDIEIIISRETELLDTGGGIKNALQHFGNQPFFALNADLPWMDGMKPSLWRMKEKWNASDMDALLLLMPAQKARGFTPGGDFTLDASGHVRRKGLPKPLPHVWISAQILKPELFAAVPDKIFSNNKIWDEAEKRGRLYGIEHDGSCYHVGTPEDLQKANALLASGQGWL
ncbi:MAG: nucleotidyltransferase family protein [Alphaproteobacteria bacterium]|nr:nucleotidyltransferase family protein [Alphaproteobacteria bacterium]